MRSNLFRFALSASMLPLIGGCAMGSRASLDIRNIENPQVASDTKDPLVRGKLLLSRGQSADAISAFRAVLRRGADQAEAHNGMAIAYDRIGRADLAQRYFELAVAGHPDDERYRKNLARLFDRTGRPELAMGLVDPAPAVIQAAVESAGEVAIVATNGFEALAMVAQIMPATQENDPIEAILAGLQLDQLIADNEPAADGETSAREFKSPAGPQDIPSFAPVIQHAALRSAAPTEIFAQQIGSPFLPAPEPPGKRVEMVADLPRNERKFAELRGPTIERVSLGEVRLVTLQERQAKPSQQQLRFSFDELGGKLAVWAEDEARIASLTVGSGLKGKSSIQRAIERAAMEVAFQETERLAQNVEAMKKQFAYVTFDEDIVGEAAAPA